jgi:hypothetical protein
VGQESLQPATKSTWGALRNVQRYVDFDLVIWGHGDPKAGYTQIPFDSDQIVTSRYDLQGGAGRRIYLTDGTSLFVERYGEASSVTWPTDLSPDAFMDRLETLLAISHEDEKLMLFVEGEAEAITAKRSDLGALLTRLGVSVEVVRVEAEKQGLALVWQRSTDDRAAFEGGLVATERFPTEMIFSVLETTGSGKVSRSIKRVANQVVEVLAS